MRVVLQKMNCWGALAGDQEQCVAFQVCGNQSKFLKRSDRGREGALVRIASAMYSRCGSIAFLTVVVCLFLELGGYQAQASSETWGSWNFDDCTATDSSGNGRHGVIHGTTCLDINGGKYLQFNNANNSGWYDMKDWVTLPNFTGSSLVFKARIKWQNANNGTWGWAAVWSIGDNSTADCLSLFVNDSGMLVADHSNVLTPEADISDGAWHNVEVVTTEVTTTLYIDGVLIGAAPVQKKLNFNNSPHYLSMHQWNNGGSSSSRLYGGIDSASIEIPNQSPGQIPIEGLVGYWSFDGGNANLTAGSANNGQPTSAVTFGSGKNGMAAIFHGVDNPGHIYIPNSSALQFSEGATYSAWVRVDSLVAMSGVSALFAKSHDRTGAAMVLSIDSASQAVAASWVASFESWAAGQSTPLLTPHKVVGDWTHLVYTLSATTGITIYVDGQLYSTSTTPVSFAVMNGQDLFLGKFSDSLYPFYGAIDEVRIYNRVLNEAEIAELAGGGSGSYNLTATPTAYNKINIGWNSISGAAVYALYRDTSAVGSFTRQIYCGSDTSYADGENLSANTTYYYKVASGDASANCSNRTTGWASPSAAVSATTWKSRPVVKTLEMTDSSVLLGEAFNVNFVISGATATTITYEKIYVDLLREDGQLLAVCQEFTDIPILADSDWSISASCRIAGDQLPGTYQVALKGKKAGNPEIYFPSASGIANPLEFTADVPPQTPWEPLTVSGYVEDLQENPVVGAPVTLCHESSSDCSGVVTNDQGRFSVQHNRPDSLSASWTLKTSVPCASGTGTDSIHLSTDGGTGAKDLLEHLQIQCSDGDKLPVIVVPGIFGSTLKNSTDFCNSISAGCYPALDSHYRKDSSEYKILSPDLIIDPVFETDVAGSKTLIAALKQAGYPVKAMPWDWRIPTDEAAGRYLKKMIDQVKDEYKVNKVHVVAHSQGGLVARAYIQGFAKKTMSADSAVAYENDIAKLVMLGTPNGGAANPYWMLEGGEPMEIDALLGLQGKINMFYSETTNRLYKLQYGENAIGFGGVNDYKIEKNEMVEFYRNEVPGAQTLMGQDALLQCVEKCDEITDGTANAFNAGVDPYRWLHETMNIYDDYWEVTFSNFGKLGDSNKVQTHLILSNSKKTIDRIDVKNNDLYDPEGLSWSQYKNIYKYGIPSEINQVWGDGTVAEGRARKPLEGIVTISTVSAGGHASLMKTLADCAVATLDSNAICSNATVRSADSKAISPMMQKQDMVASSLHVAVVGVPQPQLVDPAAHSTGINASGTVEENIPGAEVLLLDGSSAITVGNPVQGTYLLHLRGQVAGRFMVTISYHDGAGHLSELDINGVHDAGAVTSISFTLNPSLKDALQVTPVIGTPGNLAATNSSGNVLLRWDAVAGALGYRVYGKQADIAEFSLIGSTTETYYQTNIPWDENRTGKQWFFYVVALTADGHVGLFDQSVDNRPLISIPANVPLPPAIITVPMKGKSDGYTVKWNASVTTGVNYVLEESNNTNFASSTVVYTGIDLSKVLTGRVEGSTYYYRVKATKQDQLDSGWAEGANGCLIAKKFPWSMFLPGITKRKP